MTTPLHTLLFGGSIYATYVGILLFRDNYLAEFFWGFSTIIIPAIEITFFCSLSHTLTRATQSKLQLTIYYAALIPLTVITLLYGIQLSAIVIGNDYISALALENATETQYVTSPGVIGLIAAISTAYLLLGWYSYRKSGTHRRATKKTVGVTLVSGIFFLALFDASSESSNNPNLLRPELAPATGFLKTAKALMLHTDHELEVSKYLDQVNRNLVAQPTFFNPDSQYPFFNQTATTSGFPFPVSKGHNSDRQLNLIVIFAEGFSARLISAYGSEYKHLTPNLNNFAQHSMVVKNYFNHTAATYRGLQGQLTSAWSTKTGGSIWRDWNPSDDGIQDSRSTLAARSLATILEKTGYETAFISPHNNSNPLNKMIAALGFDQIYTHENISDLLGRPPTPFPSMPTPSVSDRDIFEGLKNHLIHKTEQNNNKPFFLATYNIGTHAFMDSPPSAPKFRQGDNPALNRFHEFDRALGDFIDYFLTSQMATNTVLVITADHATYPEPSYVRAITDKSYQPYFIDQIPLLVFAPHLKLPNHFDGQKRTSIDLAPSLTHLLGLSDFPNAFAGRSIFDERCAQGFGLASVSDDFYTIDEEGIRKIRLSNMPTEVTELVNTARLYTLLESKNALIPKATNQDSQTQK